MGKKIDYVTNNDLQKSMRGLYRDLRRDLRIDLRGDIHELLDQQTILFRDELDSKLNALEARVNDRFTITDSKLVGLEARLMAHTEEVVGNHSVELLENIASVIDPKGTGLKGRKYPRFHGA